MIGTNNCPYCGGSLGTGLLTDWEKHEECGEDKHPQDGSSIKEQHE